jgi:hypothetical protein
MWLLPLLPSQRLSAGRMVVGDQFGRRSAEDMFRFQRLVRLGLALKDIHYSSPSRRVSPVRCRLAFCTAVGAATDSLVATIAYLQHYRLQEQFVKNMFVDPNIPFSRAEVSIRGRLHLFGRVTLRQRRELFDHGIRPDFSH